MYVFFCFIMRLPFNTPCEPSQKPTVTFNDGCYNDEYDYSEFVWSTSISDSFGNVNAIKTHEVRRL